MSRRGKRDGKNISPTYFGGRIVNKSEIRNSLGEPIVLTSSLETTPQITERAIRRLKRNRGVGVDDIPAELLQAGEGAMAVKVSEVCTRVKEEEQWPATWAGGRIVDIFKKNGAADECDMSRGILLSYHLGKGLCNILADFVDPAYTEHMPEDQHGAVSGRGSDFASHTVRSFIEFCLLSTRSFFILFVDLVKAFDRVVRELVLGWPDEVSDPAHYLR